MYHCFLHIRHTDIHSGKRVIKDTKLKTEGNALMTSLNSCYLCKMREKHVVCTLSATFR